MNTIAMNPGAFARQYLKSEVEMGLRSFVAVLILMSAVVLVPSTDLTPSGSTIS